MRCRKKERAIVEQQHAPHAGGGRKERGAYRWKSEKVQKKPTHRHPSKNMSPDKRRDLIHLKYESPMKRGSIR